MAKLPQKLSWDMAQTVWSSILSPIISNPIMSGIQLKDIALSIGDNSINHRLQRAPQGYIITGMRGAYTELYNIESQTPNLTLILNSSAVATVDMYVY